jgi:DNA-binding transcriptional ArsR family regulator
MKDKYDLMIELFEILSDRTRFEILDLLRNEHKTPKDIQDRLNKSQSTISQQLKRLVQANIIEVSQEGVKKTYKITDPKIFNILSQISDYVNRLKKPQIEVLTRVIPDDVL